MASSSTRHSVVRRATPLQTTSSWDRDGRGLYARAGERTELEAEDYLIQSITKPSAFIAEGFTNVMPAFDYLSDQELADLIAFVQANN